MKLVIEMPDTIPLVFLVKGLALMGVRINHIVEYSTETRIKTAHLTAKQTMRTENIGGKVHSANMEKADG